MSDPVIWEITMPGMPTKQFIPLAFYKQLEAENARLQAEVEAQAKRWAESEDLISHYKQQMDEVINDCQCSRLKAEVERLRKAGDRMKSLLSVSDIPVDVYWEALSEWNAAVEGKPSV